MKAVVTAERAPEPVRVPYRPQAVHTLQAAKVETYPKPVSQNVYDAQASLPNNLYAAIIDMQTDFITGDSDPSDRSEDDRFDRDAS